MTWPNVPLTAFDGARQMPGPVAARAHRWHPGLPAPAHSEIFASGSDAVGAAFALALACDGLRAACGHALAEREDRRAILWVQDRAAVRLAGRPYCHGLAPELRHRLIHVEAKSCKDALFVLEEGLRCRDIAFVLGEIVGNPRAFTLTASRRLSLAAEKHGTALWLVRLDAQAELSSARMRWRVRPATLPPARWNDGTPGAPLWQAELFRARAHIPGQWILHDDDGILTIGRQPDATRTQAAPDHGDLAFAVGV